MEKIISQAQSSYLIKDEISNTKFKLIRKMVYKKNKVIDIKEGNDFFNHFLLFYKKMNVRSHLNSILNKQVHILAKHEKSTNKRKFIL